MDPDRSGSQLPSIQNKVIRLRPDGHGIGLELLEVLGLRVAERVVTGPRALASYRITFGASFAAALINAVFGFVVAWVLVRYEFPGRRIVDGLVDLPFALPTAVAGIALTAIYAPKGWMGQLFEPLGIKTAYSPIGIIIALTFIGLRNGTAVYYFKYVAGYFLGLNDFQP